MNFTVELTTAPIEGGDWSLLRSVIDAVPGTILLEDPEEPVLIIPVDAAEPMKAATFCDGLSKLMGFQIRSGKIQPTPEVDFEVEEDDEVDASTEVVDHLSGWVGTLPTVQGHVNREGHLVDA